MSKFMGIIIGGLEIAAGIAIEVLVPGNPLGWFLIAGGAGQVIGNVGTLLSQPQGGLGTASRNPVMPWNVVYGRAKVGGTIVYINSFGDSDKYLDIVFVLASHPCMSIDALLFDNQRVQINPANNSSFSPTQQTMNIASIVRAYGIVTVTTTGAMSDLEPGDRVIIQNVTGVTSIDRSLNGVVYVYQVMSTTQFTFLSGGLDVSLGTTGQVKTMWPNYRAKVYCEFLNGDQTATFVGMTSGTPYDGDTGTLVVPGGSGGPNPWTSQHVLNGKACAMLRLHYNDEVFSSGLPQISFRLRGKKDIYDPRNDNAVATPSVLLNGWGPNGHVGPYEGGVDLGYTWGTDPGTTNPYASVAAATDGNPTTYAAQSYRHTHEYAGCVWVFPSVPPTSPVTALTLSILSSVPSSGPGSLRSASIYYSLDGGSTWTQIYDAAVRAEQWDNVTLPTGQDTSQVQVMAFMDSHDDMTHYIYEIRLGTASASSVNGYTENSALCIADYLANTTYGFRAAYGTEIPLAPLITAANICDESVPLADGSTEPRYQCDGNFTLATSRGEILQNMLTACGGRITYSSGQFIIWPAYWSGVTLSLGEKIPSTVVFNITTSHTYGTNVQATGVVTRNLDVNPALSLWTQMDNFVYDNTQWTTRTNSDTLNWDPSTQLVTIIGGGGLFYGGNRVSTLRDIVVTIYNADTLLEDDVPGTGDKINVYDCWLDLTYPDGSTAVMKPTTSSIITQTTGSVSHPGNAVDADPATYATVERWHASSVSAPAGLQITTFVLVSAGGGPDFGTPSIEGSREFLGITAGPFTWKSKLPIRELYNGCKGMYISPANGWQNADFPPYAQDADHGYSGPAAFEGDQNLADDGGDRRWLEIQLPFTISPFAAQRLAKIELMRKRQQGAGTFSFNMSLYKTTALDIVTLTLPLLGWTAKLLEVTAHRLIFNRSAQGGGPTLGCELDLQETDPSVYEWSVTEQLAAQGVGLGVLPVTSNVSSAATGTVTAVSNTTTSVIGADGIARSQILVTWPAATDAFVTNGGHIEIQYQNASSPLGPWMSAPPVSGSATQTYISGVTDGQTYNVEIRYVNAAGSPSDWTAATPVTVSGASSTLAPGSITSGGATTGETLIWNGTAWVPGTPTGGSGGGATGLTSEIPSGTMNGTNTTFTLSATPIGALLLFVNGIEQLAGTDYTISGATITYTVAPLSTDWHMAFYGGGSGVSGLVIGFVVTSGSTGVNVAAMMPAPRSGSVSKCVVVTKTSDSSTALTFTIKKNGVSIFTTPPTIAAGTASGTVWTFTGLAASPPPLAVVASDVFTLDITSGTANWQFTAQLET